MVNKESTQSALDVFVSYVTNSVLGAPVKVQCCELVFDFKRRLHDKAVVVAAFECVFGCVTCLHILDLLLTIFFFDFSPCVKSVDAGKESVHLLEGSPKVVCVFFL
jgi:hypothetical protein